MSRKSKQPIQTLKGFKDILPDEQKYWDFIYSRVYSLALDYGFKKIDTPILEDARVYMKGTGQYSDIVEKELYTFEDKGGSLVAMRPEFTPGMVRAYLEHGMQNQTQPVKLFSFGPIFRHDNPQAGRYRQFNQFDFEILGSDAPDMDSQLITMVGGLFKIFGLDVVVEINSIGCPVCRPVYLKALVKYLKKIDDKLCPSCQERILKNPLRVLDCKNKTCINLTAQAPQIVDFLCDACKNHFVKVLENMDDGNITYSLNPRLVRGLDYYTRTVFEIYLNEEGLTDRPENAERIALGGGGRLDGLAEVLGGRRVPAVGMAGGVERVISAMRRLKIEVPDVSEADVFIAQLGEEAKKKCAHLFEDMRQCGLKVREAFSKNGLKAQLEVADKLGVKYTVIVGQKEILDGTAIIRDMTSGIQEIVVFDKVIEELKKRLLSANCVKIYHDDRQKKCESELASNSIPPKVGREHHHKDKYGEANYLRNEKETGGTGEFSDSSAKDFNDFDADNSGDFDLDKSDDNPVDLELEDEDSWGG